MNRSNAFSPNNPPAGGPGAPPPSGTPDSRWEPVFQDVSETPPARVWSGIERQLDLDDEDGVLPLYPQAVSRSALFGRWTAGVAAAFLLAFIGWWNLRSDSKLLPNRHLVATHKRVGAEKTPSSAAAAPPVALDAPALGNRSDQYAANRAEQNKPDKATYGLKTHPPVNNATDKLALVTVPLKLKTLPGADAQTDETGLETISVEIAVQQITRPATANEPVVRPTMLTHSVAEMPAPTTETQLAFSQTTRHSFLRSSSGIATPPAVTERAADRQAIVASAVAMASSPLKEEVVLAQQYLSAIQPLTIRTVAVKQLGNERIVWFSSERSDLEAKQKPARKSRPKAWVSGGIVASSFDPGVALRAVSGLAYSNATPTYALAAGNGPLPALALDSRAGRATAVQANVGVPLSDRWTVETGVGYLSGQSVVQSPVRSSAPSTDKTNAASQPTLYADLVSNSANQSFNNTADMQYGSATQRNAFVASTNYDRSVSQSVSNNYQFVQVPVQLSYELRPRRKFGLALITGMVSNLFVKNTVADAVTVNVQDGVYRPFTVAGTAGMRLRFRPTRQWSASLAGTFQRSLQSITRPEVGIQSLPQNMGVCFSVDRHF